jgi:mycobactin lysine-N-oxygenase
MTPGRVDEVYVRDDQLHLKRRYRDEVVDLPFHYIVFAIGFVPLSFSSLFCGQAAETLFGLLEVGDWNEIQANKDARKRAVSKLDELIEYDLSVTLQGSALHLPFLAGVAQGPGFPNLSCLGLVADRILLRHVDHGKHLASANETNKK